MNAHTLPDVRRAREEVRTGALRGPGLLERLLAVPARDRDVWVDQVLDLPEAPPDIPDLPRGAVPYLPAGVDEIVAVVREAPLRPGQLFVDLGSGLGRVAILAHLLSGAPAHGVELQGPLVERARACSAALGLRGVSFTHGDAADTELEGSLFFLYAPFNGDVLRRVLRRLETRAKDAPLTLCCVGLELPDERWLSARRTSCASLTIYDARR